MVRVSGTASNSQGVTDPSDVRLTITDDDAAPVMTLEVSPAVIAEAAGSSTVTVRITNGVTFAEDQEIRLSFSGTAEKDTDYSGGIGEAHPYMPVRRFRDDPRHLSGRRGRRRRRDDPDHRHP